MLNQLGMPEINSTWCGIILFYTFLDSIFKYIYIFINLFIFIYLFLAALGLRCCVQAFSSCGEWGLLFVLVHRCLLVVASLVVEPGL